MSRFYYRYRHLFEEDTDLPYYSKFKKLEHLVDQKRLENMITQNKLQRGWAEKHEEEIFRTPIKTNKQILKPIEHTPTPLPDPYIVKGPFLRAGKLVYDHYYPKNAIGYDVPRTASREIAKRGRSFGPRDYKQNKIIISNEPDFIQRKNPKVAIPSLNVFSADFDPTRFRKYKRDKTPRKDSPTFQSNVFSTDEDEPKMIAPPILPRLESRKNNSRAGIRQRPFQESVPEFRRISTPVDTSLQGAYLVPVAEIEKSKNLEENGYGEQLPPSKPQRADKFSFSGPNRINTDRKREPTPESRMDRRHFYNKPFFDSYGTPIRKYRAGPPKSEERGLSPVSVSTFPKDKYESIRKRLLEIKNQALPEDDESFRRKAKFFFMGRKKPIRYASQSAERSFEEAMEARVLSKMDEERKEKLAQILKDEYVI